MKASLSPFFVLLIMITVIMVTMASEAVSAPSTALKLCLNSTSGTLLSRARCSRGETALSLSTLSGKVTEQQGGAGSEFSVSLSAGADTDVTIPAGTNSIIGVIPGYKSLRASCASGIVLASSCESGDLTSVTVSQSLAANGTSVQCSWSNTALQAKVGRYYTKVVCADL